jgi:hypothetical protein
MWTGYRTDRGRCGHIYTIPWHKFKGRRLHHPAGGDCRHLVLVWDFYVGYFSIAAGEIDGIGIGIEIGACSCPEKENSS